MPQSKDDIWRIEWPHGSAEIQKLGGMLGPVWFRLEDGRRFQPMHIAPWADESNSLGLTGLLSRLRGEWPCVPFGTNVAPAPMPAGWTARTSDKDPFFHGFSAHNPWQLCESREGYLHLAVEYPEESPVIGLDRWICGSREGPILNVKLAIRVRRQIELPTALHLTFRMDSLPGSLAVSADSIENVIAYPCQVEPDISRLLPDGRSPTLQAVDAIDGPMDLSSLPFPFATEELVQLVNCRGVIRLQYLRENATVSLNWDQDSLPDAVLWLSNGGRSYSPWNGRHFALGIEPVAGAFDLGRVANPPESHPLARRFLKLHPDIPTTLSYTLTASVMK